MLINLNGDTVIETDSVIGFCKGTYSDDVFKKFNSIPSKYYIDILIKEYQADKPSLRAFFNSAESRDAAFQKLENHLKVTNL